MLGRVEEHQEARKVQVPFVLGGRHMLVGGGPSGDGDDAVAGRELGV